MGGLLVWDNMYNMSWLCEVGCGIWMTNWAYTCWKYMGSSVRHIELHQDGKTVSFTNRWGKTFDVKTKEIRKLREEKTLVETYEESFLFPVEVQGKTWYLHGNG